MQNVIVCLAGLAVISTPAAAADFSINRSTILNQYKQPATSLPSTITGIVLIEAVRVYARCHVVWDGIDPTLLPEYQFATYPAPTPGLYDGSSLVLDTTGFITYGRVPLRYTGKVTPTGIARGNATYEGYASDIPSPVQIGDGVGGDCGGGSYSLIDSRNGSSVEYPWHMIMDEVRYEIINPVLTGVEF